MRSKRNLIFLLLIFSFPGLRYTLSQQSSQCVAVITEINGKALFKVAGMSQFAKATWGTRLSSGDQISTSDKSQVKLLFSDNSFVILGPNSMITISAAGSPMTESAGDVKHITSATVVNISSLIFKKDKSMDAGALAGVRSVNTGQAIELESPYNTLIKTDRPCFSWSAKLPYDSYTVYLYNSDGLVWSRKVSKCFMEYPESEKGLIFGESYFWNVEGEHLIETDKSANHRFTILSPEISSEVSAYESAIRNSFIENPEGSTLHSVLGAYFIDMGLLQDAISEFQTIAGLNADACMPHEILGSLYSEVGEKDKAIEQLQKALMLSNINGN